MKSNVLKRVPGYFSDESGRQVICADFIHAYFQNDDETVIENDIRLELSPEYTPEAHQVFLFRHRLGEDKKWYSAAISWTEDETVEHGHWFDLRDCPFLERWAKKFWRVGIRELYLSLVVEEEAE